MTPLRDEVMIVDDNPNNLRLLEDMLLEQGHAVRSFPLGRLALSAAAKSAPQLILLDINMPEMSGYEVCAKLKESPQLRDIPVIFLSALTDVHDKVRAFEAGGVDYVSKPFQFEEVQARVDTQLKIHRLQRELRLHNERLEQTVRERTLELEKANKSLALLDDAKGAFLQLISHELRTPLNGLLGSLELMLMEIPEAAKTEELRAMFDQSRSRILSIIEDALLLTEIDVRAGQPFSPAPVSIRHVLQRAIERSEDFAHSRGVQLLEAPIVNWDVAGDEKLLVHAIQALIETSVRLSREGQPVRLSSAGQAVHLESSGKCLPESALLTFFDLFSTSGQVTLLEELGLGPPVAHRILRLLGASLAVQNRLTPGVRLTVSWPD